jgi:hypothetical protein
METGKWIVSFANYEGGLMGFSAEKALDFTSQKGDIKQEFAFLASEEPLTCSATRGNLLTLGGHEEVVKMFDLKTKRSCGDLSG